MKYERLKRIIAALALMATVVGTVACTPDTPPEETTNTVTDTVVESTEDSTEEETTDPAWRDTPKTGNYVTTSDLEIPEYTFSIEGYDNDGIIPTSRDVFSDTWTAVDDADRTMPSAADTPTANGKQVGIFYFLWHDYRNAPVYDHYAAYMEGGIEGLWNTMLADRYVNREPGHYWAEPYFGYYCSNDEWVIRKHAYMLTEAGVDFVYFDVTNGFTYDYNCEVVFKVWSEMRQEGYDTPKICFFAANSSNTVNALWKKFYQNDRYENLYFYWDGAPLILLAEHSGTGNPALTAEQKDYFTYRYSWAETGFSDNWYSMRGGVGCWPWRSSTESRLGYSFEGKDWVEQISVTCGHSANGGMSIGGGRSTTRGRPPKTYEGDWDLGMALVEDTSPLGLLFQEQFELALKQDKTHDIPILMITGWNEWWAQLQLNDNKAANSQAMANSYYISDDSSKREFCYFVDQFNPEYSRDIEPMKGGFTDNYLYQMTQYLRQYKGSRDVETAFGQWAIDLNGSLGQWYTVGPEYRDYEGDIVDRNATSRVGNLTYTNESGRNDIVTAKVSNDSTYLYFYVECADVLTAPEGENWMNLFINADGNDTNGWYGYDFVLNRHQDGGKVSVEAFTGVYAWEFETIGWAEYAQNGSVLQIKLPKAMINFGDTLDFKWADNSVDSGDIMQFWDMGDAAPNGRYTYRYTLKETLAASKTPAVLKNDMVVLKTNSYNAYVDGKMVRLVEDNTHGVLLASDERVWLPTSFLEDVFGISAEGETTYNHYGIEYVEATQLLKDAGKKLTVTSDGLAVIANYTVTDEATLTALYRSLT